MIQKNSLQMKRILFSCLCTMVLGAKFNEIDIEQEQKLIEQYKKEMGDWRGPDFLIIGAQKGGTSSLYDYLINCPMISKCALKEPTFFSVTFKKGLSWYRNLFPTKKDGGFLVDASTAYLLDQNTPRRVKSLVPQVKIIVLLRNPVNRAWSCHWHYKKFTGTPLFSDQWRRDLLLNDYRHDSFENLLDKEIGGKISIEVFNFEFGILLDFGLYAKYLKNWFQYFPREQFLIIKSEDFFADPRRWTNECFKFLGLPEHNLSEYPQLNARSRGSMNPTTRAMLEDFYRPHIQELEELLGRKFNWF